jgi:hypothetical protein
MFASFLLLAVSNYDIHGNRNERLAKNKSVA